MRTVTVFALGLILGGVLGAFASGRPVEALGATPQAHIVATPNGQATCFTYASAISCIR
jgi:hypothetical protein